MENTYLIQLLSRGRFKIYIYSSSIYIGKSSKGDRYIYELCEKYPKLDEYYGIKSNKGYGSKTHIEGIKQHGISPWHRKSFGLCKQHEIKKWQ